MFEQRFDHTMLGIRDQSEQLRLQQELRDLADRGEIQRVKGVPKRHPRKPSKNLTIRQFAAEVRNWRDEEIYKKYHREVDAELIDTVAKDMLDDVCAVLAPHFSDKDNEMIRTVLFNWYMESQPTLPSKSEDPE